MNGATVTKQTAQLRPTNVEGLQEKRSSTFVES